jgi:hypothetical protein
MMGRQRLAPLALAFGTTLAACGGRPPAEGDPHVVVVLATPERWSELEPEARRAIERRVSGVSDQKVFVLEHHAPESEEWQVRRLSPLILVLGEADDPWVREALAGADRRPGLPGLYRAADVWATGQVVNVLVLPPPDDERNQREHLTALYAQLHVDLNTLVRARTYAAGTNDELADTLRAKQGFALLLPDTYAFTDADSTFLFRPPDVEGIERLIAVTWMSPASDLEIGEVLSWRARVARAHYGAPQEVIGRVTGERLSLAGYQALQIRGRWARRSESGERQEGSLLTRVALCEGQNRAYLLDGWLLAPGDQTYQYVAEIETVLDTFRCE